MGAAAYLHASGQLRKQSYSPNEPNFGCFLVIIGVLTLILFTINLMK